MKSTKKGGKQPATKSTKKKGGKQPATKQPAAKADDDDDDDVEFGDFELEELNEEEKKELLNYSGQKRVWWNPPGNGRILYQLMNRGNLEIIRFNKFGTHEEVQKDVIEFEVEQEGVTEIFPGENRQSTSASSGRLYIRTLDILEKMPDRRWIDYVNKMKHRMKNKWVNEKIMTVDERVVVKKLWVGKAMSAAEQQLEGNVPGKFKKHFDNYGSESLVRIIASICDSESNKMMGFDFFGVEVMFNTPHSTVVIMDKKASGADGSGEYCHFVEGAEGTYTICMELGIAIGNEGDLQKWRDGEEDDDEKTDLENHKMGE